MKILEFNKHFNNEADCDLYLKNVREQQGLVCSACHKNCFTWDKYNKCWICRHCGKKIRLTSGTVMHGSKLPLLYWFTVIHLLTSTKKTFSASEIQRQLGHKRYQPIWEMLHKLRSIMGLRDDTHTLKGTIELDEAFFSTDNCNK